LFRHLDGLETTKCVLSRVGNVEKPVIGLSCQPISLSHLAHLYFAYLGGGEGKLTVPIFILVLFINTAHQGRSWRQDLIHEDEDGLLRRQLDALSNYIYELANREICRDEIFLLVDSRNVGFFYFLADDGDAVRVFLSLES
jgi:hypothetical protein